MDEFAQRLDEVATDQEALIKSHYTISADQIAAKDGTKLYALKRHNRRSDYAQADLVYTYPPPAPLMPYGLFGNEPRQRDPNDYQKYPLPDLETPLETYSGAQSVSPRQHYLQEMRNRIGELEAENFKLRQTHNQKPSKTSESLGVQVFHQILDQPENEGIESAGSSGDMRASFPKLVPAAPKGGVYLSEPSWYIWGNKIRLKATDLVTDPRGYVDRMGNMKFAIYKAYNEAHQVAVATECMSSNNPLPEPEPMRQDVLLASDQIKDALVSLLNHPVLRDEYGILDVNKKLEAPFPWYFHLRDSDAVSELHPGTREVLSDLTTWIEKNYGSLYDSAAMQFGHGKVSRQSIPFLYRAGHLVVVTENDIPQAHLVTSRMQSEPPGNLSTRSIEYGGAFYRREGKTAIQMKVESDDQEIEISTLNVIPLKHVSNEIRQALKRRGQMYWKCRKTRFVSYDGTPTGKRNMGNRFMIDFDTYKELHPGNTYTYHKESEKEENLLSDGEEPPSPEVYMFPPLIPAFDLRRKKWVEIEMDYIQDVAWNDNAFKSLVADEDMKELILALVTNQLAAEVGTDVIENKGNGLIMLLHGSPGTGKTFTAESVAEIARKPLYSVTCGDIGTEPEKVERYLESVFHLGKIWNCVVLLDEAEVFLEQRSLQDLGRNALVSVFLRALEYYEGILILTTNRVGSFDEAFKSRIQLALRYENLKRPERKQIWRNFMNRLKGLEEKEREKIDFADVENHIDDLADYEMNGRQIRNSITTARQLAQYRGQRLNFAYLKRTIKVADRFDKYLSQVREADVEEFEGKNSRGGGGEGKYTSDDYIARSEQMR